MAKKNILICDDEEGIRESLKLILENKYELTVAENGRQCLDCLEKKHDIDLIILDIKMPRMSGLDVLIELKKRFPAAKVLMVSGYRSVETAQEASHLGADDYITKPFEKNEILDTIQRLTTEPPKTSN